MIFRKIGTFFLLLAIQGNLFLPAYAAGTSGPGASQAELNRLLQEATGLMNGLVKKQGSARHTSTVVEPECLVEKLNVSLVSKESSLPFHIAMGDHVSLSRDGGEPLQAVFLGRTVDDDFFYLKDANEIATFPAKDSTYINRNKQVVAASQPGAIQPLLKIEKQRSNDCHINGMLNCMRFLDSLGLVADEYLKANLSNAPERVFSVLQKFSQVGRGPRAQMEMQKLYFDKKGIPTRDDATPDSLIKHLKTGRPALILFNAKLKNSEIKNLKTGTSRSVESSFPTGFGSRDRVGSHVVLAVGYFETGPLAGKILILDSGSGTLNVWDKSELTRQMDRDEAFATLAIPKETGWSFSALLGR